LNFEKMKLDPRMPKHIGFIIDGNGRWAKRRGLPRSAGHQVGSENVKKHIEYCQQLGIPNVSFYCFSSENWKRSEKEVKFLMEKFDEMLDEYKKDYLDKNVRIIISGDMTDERLPLSVRQKAEELMLLTKDKTELVLNMCINYGGRDELLMAFKKIAEENGEYTEENVEKHLYTKDMLPLDFVIRTSGEKRSSNFMPWQSTYSEWLFPKKTWPAFSKCDLVKALKIYMKRNRRFGGVK